MVNILFCSPKSSTGGISQWTKNILAYWVETDQNAVLLDWFYPTGKGKKAKTLSSTLPLPIRILRGVRCYLPFVRAVRKKIKTGNYDVLHLSTSGSISFIKDYFTLKAAKAKGLKTVVHFHFGRMDEVLSSNSLEKRLFDKCKPYIDRFIAMDENTYRALLDYGCQNVFNVPNPLSPEIENRITACSQLQRENRKVVFAGHVLKGKGVYELVQACRNIPEISLEILGQCTPETKTQLESLAGDNADWLKIRGNCSLSQVIEAMTTCAVFVLPSYSEGFPNVIIEAMACGTPIVATPVGAIKQMLTSCDKVNCGVIVAPRQAEELQRAIEKVLSDSSFADEIGRNAYEKVHNSYSMAIVWSKLKEIWLN